MNFPTGLYGDKDLKPEKISTVDLGISYQGEQMQFGGNFFYSKQTDIIQPVFLPMSFERRYTNLSKVTFIGGEFEGKYYLNNNVFIQASSLYQTNEEDKTKEKNVTPISELSAKAGISYMSDNGITVGLFNIYQGDLDDRYMTDKRNPDQGAYNYLHLHTNFNLNKLFSLTYKLDYSLFLNIDNLLDQRHYGYSFQGNDGIPVNPGRAIYAGLKVDL
ncbi:MAG: TonB-dependent receptor [Calditrichaceae bacterium]|nr:TonB-dependent receptor [Calditrichaceae bacterium]MBN2707831.1 TonB-dependent receptor [Calditrichaceae bacterium]RQV94897.1 MAG: TonB-dependent receptor [Calditrichota bacterium]